MQRNAHPRLNVLVLSILIPHPSRVPKPPHLIGVVEMYVVTSLNLNQLELWVCLVVRWVRV